MCEQGETLAKLLQYGEETASRKAVETGEEQHKIIKGEQPRQEGRQKRKKTMCDVYNLFFLIARLCLHGCKSAHTHTHTHTNT